MNQNYYQHPKYSQSMVEKSFNIANKRIDLVQVENILVIKFKTPLNVTRALDIISTKENANLELQISRHIRV